MDFKQKPPPKVILLFVVCSIAAIVMIKGCFIPLYERYQEHMAAVRQQEAIRLANEEKALKTKQLLKTWALPDEKQEDVKLPVDAWGQEIKMKIDPGIVTDYHLRSAGIDQKFGTSDDILLVRSGSIRVDRAGAKVGEKTTEFGVGLLKGAKKTLKKAWDGEYDDK